MLRMGKQTEYSSYCRKCGYGTNKMAVFCLIRDCGGRMVSRGLALKTLGITPEKLDARNMPHETHSTSTPVDTRRSQN